MFELVYCEKEVHELGGPGIFFLGDAQNILHSLLDEYKGRVQLIYLDPPFEEETYRLNSTTSIQLSSLNSCNRTKDLNLSLMHGILTGCHALLKPTGSIYLHANYKQAAHMRLLLDEVFGAANFMNEIIWTYRSGGRSTKHFSRKHDNILFYRKSENCYFNIEEVGIPRGANSRNHLRKNIDQTGKVFYSLKTGGKTYRYYEDSLIYPSDVWTDIEYLHQNDPERSGFPSQRPEALLKRILAASTREGDIVADLYSGSGTTAAVASKLGRFFLACDSSPFGLYALRKRQHQAYNIPNLFDEAHPLEFRYPSDKPVSTLNASASKSDGFLTIELNNYIAEGKACELVYCALGSMRQDSFYPEVFFDSPALPVSLKMPLKLNTQPILQTMDIRGIQGFWSLKMDSL